MEADDGSVFVAGRGGTVIVATNDGYWDALTGAAVCGRNASVLVLVGKDNQPKPWRAFDAVSQLGTITHGHVYGGTAAVSQAAWNHFTNS